MRQPPAWLCAAALTLAFVGLAAWTWGALADPMVDFGQQVYAPWQVAQGAVLYRDVTWFLGPLSVHLHAALFTITGPSLVALNLLNLTLLAAFLGGLFLFVAWLSDRVAALTACALVMTLFGFSHLSLTGNYALAAPYAHEASHGLYLILVTLAAAAARLSTGRRAWTACAGAAVAMAFLTKPEMFLAAAVSAGVAGLAAWRREPPGGCPDRRDALAFGGAASGVLLLAWAGLAARRGSLPGAAGDVAGAWRHLHAVGGSAFYASGAGLDRPLEHLLQLLFASAVVGTLLLIARWALARSDQTRTVTLLVLVFSGAGVMARWPALLPRAILPAAIVLVVLLTRRLLQADDPNARARLGASLAGACAAVVLLVKQGLFPRFHHYGFVLALPATVGVVAAVVHGLPARAEAAGRDAAWCRKLALYLLAFLAAVLFKTTASNVAARDHVLAPGIRTRAQTPEGRPYGPILSQALAALRATPAEATCLVLPEGILLNALAERPAPTRFTKHMPHELAAFGEDRALSSLIASSPELVVVLHRDLTEFDAQPFGQNPFDRRLLAWVQTHYPRVVVLGDGLDPAPDRFGAELRSGFSLEGR